MDDQGEAVKKAMKNMVRIYEEKGLISPEDAATLSNYTQQLVDIPLTDLGEDIAQMQIAYKETLTRL
jgi:hypothetical protein